VLFALVACSSGSSGGGGGGGTPDVFVAFAQDFAGYQKWESFAIPAGNVADFPDLTGPRTVYLRARPPTGSKEFPVGTMIVKEIPASSKIFAMVKRGGSYNTQGAANWEWFELANGADTTIVWRGVGPPLGEQYGGNPATCNDCHRGSASNDFVRSPPLTLEQL
jgi:hypothetical protein